MLITVITLITLIKPADGADHPERRGLHPEDDGPDADDDAAVGGRELDREIRPVDTDG